MSGDLFITRVLRETGLQIDEERVGRLRRLHAEAYNRRAGTVRALPGARELLAVLRQSGIPWAIATSGRLDTAEPALAAFGTELDGGRRATARSGTTCFTISSPAAQGTRRRLRRSCSRKPTEWSAAATLG